MSDDRKQIKLRLPADLDYLVNEECEQKSTTPQEIIRDALAKRYRVKKPAAKRGRPKKEPPAT